MLGAVALCPLLWTFISKLFVLDSDPESEVSQLRKFVVTPYAGTMQGIDPTNTWLFSAAGSKPRPFIYIILPPFTDPVREEVYVFIKVEAYWIESGYETADTTRRILMIVCIFIFIYI